MGLFKIIKVIIKSFLFIFKKIIPYSFLLDLREQAVDKTKFEYNLIRIQKTIIY